MWRLIRLLLSTYLNDGRHALIEHTNDICAYNASVIENIMIMDGYFGTGGNPSESLWFKLLDHKDSRIRSLALQSCLKTWIIEIMEPVELFEIMICILVKLQSRDPDDSLQLSLRSMLMQKLSVYLPVCDVISNHILENNSKVTPKDNQMASMTKLLEGSSCT